MSTGNGCRSTFPTIQMSPGWRLDPPSAVPLITQLIAQLENELKIQQITDGDLVDEANEYVKEIVRLKDKVNSMSSQSALASSGADLDRLKSEIIAQKKSHLVALN